MNARVIPEAIKQVQIEASDPAASAWVAANAGSGKTHVLAQRVIRLMLEERFLRRELPGYSEYAARVPYRMLPGIW